ncbi:MAG: radical SAM/SPASM domain-containing protein [Acidobacteriota bacterium]
MPTSRLRLRQALGLARDWVLPGPAIAQWTHFVTSTCNAKCRHCFYPINQHNNELTLDEIQRLVRTLPPIRLLLFSGGEPFLRRDLPEIIAAYFEQCRFFTVSIPTNGFSASRIGEMVDRICAISPDLHLGITVSLDGMGEFHDRVRRVPGLWERAMATLRAMVERTARHPNLTAGVNTVFMRENQDDAEALCEFIHREVRPTFHSLILIRGNPLDRTLAEGLDIDRYERLSRWLDQRYTGDAAEQSGWRGVRARARQEINRQRFEYIARQARGGEFEGFCLAGEREYVMSEVGDVYGCELIEDKLGNVRDVGYDFARIRESEAARAFVAGKHERLCRCTHECNARTMLLFDRRKALPVVGAALGRDRQKP